MKRLWILFLIILILLTGCNSKVSKVDASQGEIKEALQNPVVANHLTEVDFSGLNKIGVIPVVSDKSQRRYIEKEEKYNSSENELKMFKDLIAKAKVNEYIELDRLPGEYKVNLYFKDGKKLTAYYWVMSKENNFSIDGVIGEITLDSTIMNQLITKIVGESIRKPNTDPYSG